MKHIWDNPGIQSNEVNARLVAEGKDYKKVFFYLVNSCVRKGVLRKEPPHNRCFPVVGKDEVYVGAMGGLLESVFGGSISALVQSLVVEKNVSAEELQKIREIIDSIDVTED